MAQIQLPGVGYVDDSLTGQRMLPGGGYSSSAAASGDTTPPTLSAPTAAAAGSTAANGSVTTDEANGTLYRLASTNASETAATVKAAALTQAVTATGSQAVSFTGLSPSTTYYAHYVHRDAAGNDSAVASSASFTTDASGTSPVTADLALAYVVRGAVQRDLALSYSILAGGAVNLGVSPTHVLRNNTTSILANTQFRLSFYRSDNDAFVVNKTVTSDASGLLGTVSDGLLTPGVSYDIKLTQISTGGKGIFVATAS